MYSSTTYEKLVQEKVRRYTQEATTMRALHNSGLFRTSFWQGLRRVRHLKPTVHQDQEKRAVGAAAPVLPRSRRVRA